MELEANNTTAERVNNCRKSFNLLAQSRSFATVIGFIFITYLLYYMFHLGSSVTSGSPPFTLTINRAKFCDTDSLSSLLFPNFTQLENLVRRKQYEGSGDT